VASANQDLQSTYRSRSRHARKFRIMVPMRHRHIADLGTGRFEPDCRDMPKPSNAPDFMTSEQAALLKKLAFDAYEPEAFSPSLTQAEADQRIDMLQAKLRLMGEPPHTQ